MRKTKHKIKILSTTKPSLVKIKQSKYKWQTLTALLLLAGRVHTLLGVQLLVKDVMNIPSHILTSQQFKLIAVVATVAVRNMTVMILVEVLAKLPL